MQKIWLAILVFLTLSACAEPDSKSSKRHSKKSRVFSAMGDENQVPKRSIKSNPSELIQSEILKNKKYVLSTKSAAIPIRKAVKKSDPTPSRKAAKKSDQEFNKLEDVQSGNYETVAKTKDPTGAKYDGHYKIGRPYKIKGVTYNPEEYEGFEEVGQSSWYGEDFHGKATANGEIYDMNGLTAAHRTLPLPSIVRVTNLANGKSIVVRVNDRGPFAHDRVIDLSKRSADMLGFKDKGVANVKVQFLKKDTKELLARLELKK